MGLGSLFASALTTSSIVSDLVLVKPNNDGYMWTTENIFNFFYFHSLGEQSIQLSSDITDHFIEKNAALQDHIAIRPETVTVTGFVGELNNVVPFALKPAKEVVEKLGTLQAYLPGLAIAALRTYNLVEQTYRVVSKASTAFVGEDKSEQQKAFDFFYELFLARKLFSIETPYAQWKEMAIQNIRFTQTQDDKNSSDIEITFKKIRLATTELTTKKSSRVQGTKVNK